jgi:Tfp pilus assembly protein PilN
MRPVNLIPTEQRRGQQAPARTGRIAPYVVVGGLLVALGCVSVLVLTGNQISDRKAELAEAKAQDAALQKKVQQTSAYTQFGAVRDQRTATVASLADSRFDWERVLNELSLVLPDNVWLIGVTGTVSPGVALAQGTSVEQRDSVPGPALEIVGCAPSQDAVAGFVSALHDIDGVTRVGLSKSDLPDAAQSAPTGGAGGAVASSGSSDCQTRAFITRFEIVVAFDAAPVPGSTTAPPVTTPDGTAPVSNGPAGAGQATQQEDLVRQSIETQSDKARDAITTFTP